MISQDRSLACHVNHHNLQVGCLQDSSHNVLFHKTVHHASGAAQVQKFDLGSCVGKLLIFNGARIWGCTCVFNCFESRTNSIVELFSFLDDAVSVGCVYVLWLLFKYDLDGDMMFVLYIRYIHEF